MKAVPAKDPNNVEPFFFIWCDEDGTNDGSSSDGGELQGATISSYSVEVVDGDVEIDSDNSDAVTVAGVDYSANTAVTVWLSGGTEKSQVLCRVTLSDNRVLDETMIVPIVTR